MQIRASLSLHRENGENMQYTSSKFSGNLAYHLIFRASCPKRVCSVSNRSLPPDSLSSVEGKKTDRGLACGPSKIGCQLRGRMEASDKEGEIEKLKKMETSPGLGELGRCFHLDSLAA